MGGNNHLIAQDFSMLDLTLSASHWLCSAFYGIFPVDSINCQTDEQGKKKNQSSKHIPNLHLHLINISFTDLIYIFFFTFKILVLDDFN